MTLDEDGDDHSVHTEDTGHDHGNDGLEEQVGSEDGDRHDTDARLGSSVSGTEVGEHEGRDDAHDAEKDTLVGVAKG